MVKDYGKKVIGFEEKERFSREKLQGAWVQPKEVRLIDFCPEKAFVKGRISSKEPDAPGKSALSSIR